MAENLNFSSSDNESSRSIGTDFYHLKSQVVGDAYDRLITNIGLHKERNNIATLTITGCGPYVGTTTIAVNMSVEIASIGWKTLLISADLKKRVGRLYTLRSK